MPTIYKTRGKTTTATRMTVEEIVEAIRNKKYLKEVAEFREMGALANVKKRENGTLDIEDAAWEKALPRICFACDYQKRGGEMHQVTYNGLILLEVNNLQSEEEAIGLRFYAGRQPQTLLAFVGADGRSVCIVCRAEMLQPKAGDLFSGLKFKVSRTKEAGDPVSNRPETRNQTLETASQSGLTFSDERLKAFHRNAYAKAQKFYTGQLEVTVDVLEPRLDRVCYMSADGALCYNPEAIPFYVDAQESFSLSSPYRPQKAEVGTLPGRDAYQTQMIIVQECLAKAYEEALTIDDDQESIVAVLTYQAHFCMESGVPKELAKRITLMHPELRKDSLLADRIFDNAYTPKALRRMMKRNPETAALRHIPESTLLMLKTTAFMEQNYQFRKNVLTGVAQYRPVARPYFDYMDVTEEDRNSMTIRALEAGLKSWDKDIKRYIESKDIPQYDPIEDYLLHLPAWDGRDRLADFARRVPTNDGLWQRFFPLWMRSMVAHWLGKDREHGNALVPLLIGPQGCGKSAFCGIVLPEELRAYYNDRVSFNNEFDLLNQMSSFALINIDEFDSIGASRQPLLKYLLSTPDVKLRVPYGKAVSQRRRYASFIATTNQQMPLTDLSGARRFLCVNVDGRIDTDSRVDYAQLYAQLLAEIQAGQRYWLTDEETAEVIAHNEPFRQVDSIEEMVRALYRKPKSDDSDAVILPVAKIVSILQERFPGVQANRATFIKVGKILVNMGCEGHRSSSGNAYQVVVQEK